MNSFHSTKISLNTAWLDLILQEKDFTAFSVSDASIRQFPPLFTISRMVPYDNNDPKLDNVFLGLTSLPEHDIAILSRRSTISKH